MDMKKIFLAMILLMLVGSAFATTSNAITYYQANWDAANHQVILHLTCSSQGMVTATLESGMSKDIICPTIDLGQTWFVGDIGTPNTEKVSIALQGTCNKSVSTNCNRSYVMNVANPAVDLNSVGGVPVMWIFLGIIVVIVVILLMAVGKLGGPPVPTQQ